MIFEEKYFQGEKIINKRPRFNPSVCPKGQDLAMLPWEVSKEQISDMHRLKLVD